MGVQGGNAPVLVMERGGEVAAAVADLVPEVHVLESDAQGTGADVRDPIRQILVLLHGRGSHRGDLMALRPSIPSGWGLITPQGPPFSMKPRVSGAPMVTASTSPEAAAWPAGAPPP